MKRKLIAVILASLATAAFAEPTLQLQADENRVMNAPEATSYIADAPVVRDDAYQVFNP
jgi:hypothetical protein